MTLYGECPDCHETFYSQIQKDEHVCMNPGNYTSSEATIPKIDINDLSHSLSRISANYRGILAKSFIGIPVRLDPELEGNQYYLCISKDLLAAMEKNQKG